MDHERREALKLAVFGAGAIGCYVGGCLAAAGHAVTLIVRPRVADELAAGLHVTDLDGRDQRAPVTIATEPAAADGAEVILVTVKSAATAAAAEALRERGGGSVLSLQNGVRNAATLRAALPDRRVIAGMVPFNVIRTAAHVHRASSGAIAIERGHGAIASALRGAGLAVAEHADMTAVQWAKLVMNLNNAINALSGLPLAAELAQRLSSRARRRAAGSVARARA